MVCEVWAEAWDGWMGEGGCGFSSLMKQNQKAKICFVIYIAGFFFKKKFCYEVFAKQKKRKESRNNYYHSRQGRGKNESDLGTLIRAEVEFQERLEATGYRSPT